MLCDDLVAPRYCKYGTYIQTLYVYVVCCWVNVVEVKWQCNEEDSSFLDLVFSITMICGPNFQKYMTESNQLRND